MKSIWHVALVMGYALTLLISGCATMPLADRPIAYWIPKKHADLRYPTGYEASFSCQDPQSVLQEVICDDEALAALDRDMGQAFRRNVRALDIAGHSLLMADQRRWLLRRQAQCQVPVQRSGKTPASAIDCLKNMYRKRNAQLSAWPLPQAKPRTGQHPLAAYVEFRIAEDREPALCSALAKQFNDAISERGDIDPSRMAGFTELVGSHGPASLVRDVRKFDVELYDAGAYASYQMRAKGLTVGGQLVVNDKSLADWTAQMLNSGGSFTSGGSQTSDYAAIDAFLFAGRELVLVRDTWGYYAAAARGESPHAGVYELAPDQALLPRCLYRTYIAPPGARIFDRLPVFKDLGDALQAMAGDLPAGLTGDERRDEGLFEREMQWTLFNMPLVALDEIERFGRKASLRRRHDEALEAIFVWSERNLPSKLLYRRLMPTLQQAQAELVRAYSSTQGLKPEEATAAADLMLMFVVDRAAENLLGDQAAANTAAVPANYVPRYAAAPTPGDLEKNRPYLNLHSAVLNRASTEVVADFIKFESTTPAASRGRGPAGDTALMAAVRSPETVTQLLASGADVNASNDWQKTALMSAAQTNQFDSAKLLIEAGAEVERKTLAWHAEGAGGLDNDEGATPSRTAFLYAAAGAGAPLLRLLIDHGASTTARDDTGASPCEYLAQNKILTEAEKAGFRPELCKSKGHFYNK